MKKSSTQAFFDSFKSWRTAAVSLLSFSSGLPLGLIWIGIPDWMGSIGVDIRLIGLFTLVQIPWSLKFLWAPIMDRYKPIRWMGRHRGWTLIAQVTLFVLTLALAGVGAHPDTPWVVAAYALAIVFASASQDIALDAYAVDVLHTNEYGTAVGARSAFYRLAMVAAGGAAISVAGRTSWPFVLTIIATMYLLMGFVTIKAPEGEEKINPPQSFKDAIWLPLKGFISIPRSMEILCFVILYKFADNLAAALLNPFLIDMGYNSDQRGLAIKTVGLFCTLGGTFLGGFLSTLIGLGHSLWIFGALQIFSNVGYVMLSQTGTNPALFYGAMGFETFTQGLGAGSFSVLLLRLTHKRFSATQFALFSSMVAITRVLGGALSGFAVKELGWTDFYYMTMLAGLPGLLFLYRFSPIGVRDPMLEQKDV